MLHYHMGKALIMLRLFQTYGNMANSDVDRDWEIYTLRNPEPAKIMSFEPHDRLWLLHHGSRFCYMALLLILALPACREGIKEGGQLSEKEKVSASVHSFQPDPLFRRLHDSHGQFREGSITDRRFKHADIEPLIRELPPPFSVQHLGESVEARAIYEVQIGEGDIPVLLWSQMHGDEPTATMALMDIFRFFQAQGDDFDSLRQRLRANLRLHCIPMLNPDGAEVYERRNALDIDLNRDALRLQSPESQILKAARERTQAIWGFNLHDQNRYYAAGDQPKTASVSFLAPAFNTEKDINEGRASAMQLIVYMNEILQNYIPGRVGRYDDTFEPRAFGDNMQKWGTNTILIESGGLPEDPEKQYLRQLHFTILLAALDAIASGQYADAPREWYEDIPYNEGGDYHDLLLRGLKWRYEGDTYTVDVAFRHREIELSNQRDFYWRASISDIGDLSTQHGYEELQASAYQAVSGRTYPEPLEDFDALQQLDLLAMLRRGYTSFQLKKRPSRALYDDKPVEIVPVGNSPTNDIRMYGNPSLLLEQNGVYHYAVINGFLYDLRTDAEDFAL